MRTNMETMRKIVTASAMMASAGIALGQSATVVITSDAPGNVVAPGGTATITVSAEFLGGGPGLFGPAGLFGFGGDAVIEGAGTGANPVLNGDLTFGMTLGSTTANGISRIGAGRGEAPALVGPSAALFSFVVDVPADSAPGSTIQIAYDGAVVLDTDGTLMVFSNDGGANPLAITGLTLEVGIPSNGCNPADLSDTPPGSGTFGQLDGNDISAFVSGFLANEDLSDVSDTPPGSGTFGQFDGNDISAFVSAFLAGCPGA